MLNDETSRDANWPITTLTSYWPYDYVYAPCLANANATQGRDNVVLNYLERSLRILLHNTLNLYPLASINKYVVFVLFMWFRRLIFRRRKSYAADFSAPKKLSSRFFGAEKSTRKLFRRPPKSPVENVPHLLQGKPERPKACAKI